MPAYNGTVVVNAECNEVCWMGTCVQIHGLVLSKYGLPGQEIAGLQNLALCPGV